MYAVCMYIKWKLLWENLLYDWLSLSPWSQLKAQVGLLMGFRPVSNPQKGQVWYACMYVCLYVCMYGMYRIEMNWPEPVSNPFEAEILKKWSCGVALHRCGGVCVYVCASPYLSEAKINNAKWLIIIIYHHFPISYVPIGMGMFHYQVRHVRLPQGSWSNRNRSIKLVSDGFWCLSSCRHVVLS